MPAHLRKGPWFFLAPYYLALFAFLVVYFRPASFDFLVVDNSLPELNSSWHYCAIAFAVNGCAVLGLLLWNVGPAPLVTYTITSWSLLTAHNVLSSVLPFFPALVPALGPVREFLRFPVLVAHTVTFVIWNFVLAPAIYRIMPTPEKKRDFMKWILAPFMFEIHVFNYPIAVVSTLGEAAKRRPLVIDDLWCALLVAFYYALVYLFLLDRLGVHFYPIFSPRSKWCVVAWSSLFAIYLGTFNFWNAAIEEAEGSSWGGVSSGVVARVARKIVGM